MTTQPFTIAISPGHTPTNPGATRGNVTEYGLTSAIVGDMIYRLDKLGHIVHLIGSDSNQAQVDSINELDPDFGLELHFNASVRENWNGTMCLHAGAGQGVEIAEKIQKRLVSALGTKDRGTFKAHFHLDKSKPLIEMVRDTDCPFVVVEPLYFSNLQDFEKIDIPLISIALVNGCLDYWETVT